MGLLARFFGRFAGDEEVAPSFRVRLRDLEDRVDSIALRQKSIESDWDQTYDKLKHMSARIVKRAAAFDKERAEAEETSTAPDARSGEIGTPGMVRAGGPGTHELLMQFRRRNGLLPR